MSLADRDRSSQISKDEYSRFVNRLSPVGFSRTFENLPFILQESFEHLQENNQLYVYGSRAGEEAGADQEENIAKICAKTRVAIELAVWDSEYASLTGRDSSDVRPFPQCLVGMIRSDINDDMKLDEVEFKEFVLFMSEGKPDVTDDSLKVSFDALKDDVDDLISVRGLPFPNASEQEELLRICDLTNSAVLATLGRLNSN